MIGADYSTKFSPWLALGCISARLILSEVRSYESQRVKNKDTYWVMPPWYIFDNFISPKIADCIFFVCVVPTGGL